MTRTLSVLCLFLASLIVACGGGGSDDSSAQKKVAYPLAEGNSWSYKWEGSYTGPDWTETVVASKTLDLTQACSIAGGEEETVWVVETTYADGAPGYYSYYFKDFETSTVYRLYLDENDLCTRNPEFVVSDLLFSGGEVTTKLAIIDDPATGVLRYIENIFTSELTSELYGDLQAVRVNDIWLWSKGIGLVKREPASALLQYWHLHGIIVGYFRMAKATSEIHLISAVIDGRNIYPF